MRKREIKKYNKELERRVAKLRGDRGDRLFRADVDLITESGVRINRGQVVHLHKNTDHPHLEMLPIGEEIHYREHEEFIKG